MLETWIPARLELVLKSGRTRPVVLNCVQRPDDEADSKLLVVKTLGSREITEANLFAELFGNQLARELEIATPAPSIVEIDDEFVRVVNPSIQRDGGLALVAGRASGAEYLGPGLASPIRGAVFSAEETEEALSILAFDLLFQNPDRRANNPNCAVREGHFVAFDFEMCFSFMVPIIGAAAPWELSRTNIAPRHIFFDSLKGREYDFEPVLRQFDQLTDQRLQELSAWVPQGWTNMIGNITRHITDLREHRATLAVELNRCLA